MKKTLLLIALIAAGCETTNKPDLNRVPKIKDPPVPQIHTSNRSVHDTLWAGPDHELTFNSK